MNRSNLNLIMWTLVFLITAGLIATQIVTAPFNANAFFATLAVEFVFALVFSSTKFSRTYRKYLLLGWKESLVIVTITAALMVFAWAKLPLDHVLLVEPYIVVLLALGVFVFVTYPLFLYLIRDKNN